MAKESKEGVRGFAVLLQQLDEGSVHAELSEVVQRVTKELSELSDANGATAKGSITLTLSLAARSNGTVDVNADVKVKTPKPRRAASTFWATASGNLSPENPKQTRLPLREVTAAAEVPRDIALDNAPARTSF